MIFVAWGMRGGKFPMEWAPEGVRPSDQPSTAMPAPVPGKKPEYKPWGMIQNPSQGASDRADSLPKMEILHRWESGSLVEATEYYKGLLKNGIPRLGLDAHGNSIDVRTSAPKIAPARVWRFRGFPQWLSLQSQRLRLPQGYAKKCEFNPELKYIASQLGQLSERFVKNMRNAMPHDGAACKDALDLCEHSVARMHLMAAAAAQALDDARAAYGLPTGVRTYSVSSEHDDVVKPKSNGSPKKPVENVS